MEPRPKKLLDQLRDAIRLKHYAYRTEETYVQWVRRYILFHDKRHPSQMGRGDRQSQDSASPGNGKIGSDRGWRYSGTRSGNLPGYKPVITFSS
ncbi:phage integrase N-terminal SAM-like domain-containing protein [Argonema antarcticum A004/B2]|nr:phage integrase N-terminal SAM-like domain-containing protein [Argonema antarcticum A004/B2]